MRQFLVIVSLVGLGINIGWVTPPPRIKWGVWWLSTVCYSIGGVGGFIVLVKDLFDGQTKR